MKTPLFPLPRSITYRLVFAFAFLAIGATGCSGISASKSISPLDFILPGLMQKCPPAPVVPLLTNSAPLLAQAGTVSSQQPQSPALQNK